MSEREGRGEKGNQHLIVFHKSALHSCMRDTEEEAAGTVSLHSSRVMCFATAASTVFHRKCFPILQKMAQIISCTVVLEPAFVDVSQGQKTALGKVLGSPVPADLALPAAFQIWAQAGVRVQFLVATIPLAPLTASRDCLGVLG